MKKPLAQILRRVISATLVMGAGLGLPNTHAVYAATPEPTLPQTNNAACDPDGTAPSGAIYRICVPASPFWNGDLIVFAHGYVAPNQPVAIPESQLTLGGTSIISAALALGYAFATTSYRANGFVVKEGQADLIDLVNLFKASKGAPAHVILIGASEGSLITTLAIERHPEIFSGGLAICGPIGDFQKQVDYFGDFRVVFDAFYPGLLPGTAISVPQSLIANWDAFAAITLTTAISNDVNSPLKLSQLMSVTGAAVDSNNLISSTLQTVAEVLWYNVFATNDGIAKLGGQPYSNTARLYSGSLSDATLNANVARFTSDFTATQAIERNIQTTGNLFRPLITMHTTGDDVIPFFHQALYKAKVVARNRTANYVDIAIPSYGHCAFTPLQLQTRLSQLVPLVAASKFYRVALPVVYK